MQQQAMDACEDSRTCFTMKRKICSPPVKAHLSDFFGNTSIHGLRYLTEPRRPLHERVLWLICLLLSVGASVTFIAKAWLKWKESPVIVAMDETQRPIWEIPFPAVTLCPETKIRKSMYDPSLLIKKIVMQMSENGSLDISDKEKKQFSYLSVQCKNDIGLSELSENITLDNTVIDMIENLSLPLDDLIIDLQFGNFYARIQPEMILTDEGICYSFNMLPANHIFVENTFHSSRNYLRYDTSVDWTIDGGFPKDSHDHVYPYRSLSSGQPTGFTALIVTPVKDFEYFCSLLEEGYKVELHSPAEIPRPRQHSFRVPLNSVVEVAVTPSEIITDESLRHKYSVKERQCYFQDEKQLRFFKQYTQQNCEIECLANITLQRCGCVLYHMPRTMNTSICRYEKSYCAKRAARALQSMEAGWTSDDDDTEVRQGETTCNCLQSCTHILYLSEKSHSNFNISRFVELFPSEKNLSEAYFSRVSIYFKESYFIPTRRLELYGVMDFLSNCGGLLGLCLGMSVLSLVEVFYWLVVRPLCRRRKVASQAEKKHSV